MSFSFLDYKLGYILLTLKLGFTFQHIQELLSFGAIFINGVQVFQDSILRVGDILQIPTGFFIER